jgi:hypothetical protein
MKYVLIGIVAVAVVVWLTLRRRRNASAVPALPDAEKSGETDDGSRQYHSVSITPGLHQCAAVKDLAGVRIVSAEAPPLPLPDCDIDECSCRYQHHDDRRVAGDRRSPFTGGGAWQLIGDPDKDQRSGRDRREDDNADPN